MGSLLLVGFGFCLLVLETALATFAPISSFLPNLMLPIAIFLGVSAQVHILRGVLTSFVLGYFLDSFCGTSMGLQTFALTASFLLARGAGVRLLAQGRFIQVFLCFIMAVTFGATVLALRAIFEQPAPLGWKYGASSAAVTLVRSAVATGLLSPLLFAAAQRIEVLAGVRREKRTLSR